MVILRVYFRKIIIDWYLSLILRFLIVDQALYIKKYIKFRNIHKDIQNQPTIIEINLLKVRVTTLTKQYEFSPIRVIQFSRYDNISQLYDRLIYPDQQDNYRLRLVNWSSEDESRIKDELDNLNRFETDLENDNTLIKPNEESVMSLNLDKTSLLIVERWFANAAKFFPKEERKTRDLDDSENSKAENTNRDDSKNNILDNDKKFINPNNVIQEVEEEHKEENKLESSESQTHTWSRVSTQSKQEEGVDPENNASEGINNLGNPKVSCWIPPQNNDNDIQINNLKGSELKNEEEKKIEEDQEKIIEVTNEKITSFNIEIHEGKYEENDQKMNNKKVVSKDKNEINKDNAIIESKIKEENDIKNESQIPEILQEFEQVNNVRIYNRIYVEDVKFRFIIKLSKTKHSNFKKIIKLKRSFFFLILLKLSYFIF